jgi:non-homologous end joining protein Ku
MRIIQGKAKGKKVALAAQDEPPQAEVSDLMERLRRSLDQRGTGKLKAIRPGLVRKAIEVTRRPKKRRAG